MTNYARQNVAVVNTDKGAFMAAKLRRERERSIDTHISTLEAKINKLEMCVKCLEDQLREMNQK